MAGFEVRRETLEPGDHIYSWRGSRFLPYAHHGIFVNEDRVIHYQGGTTKSSNSSRSSQRLPCQVCGDQSKARGVISSCLECFLTGGKLHLFEYGVSLPYFRSKRGGTCTTVASDNIDIVLDRAEYLLEKGFGEYNLVTNNCEHFALFCKTENTVRSEQVQSVLEKLGQFLGSFF